jgi:hypothetical protein
MQKQISHEMPKEHHHSVRRRHRIYDDLGINDFKRLVDHLIRMKCGERFEFIGRILILNLSSITK